jgi:outer membrane protein assembly factor BamA
MVFYSNLFARALLPMAGLAGEPALAPPATRMEWMEAQQDAKAMHLKPARKPKAEEILETYIGEDPLNRYLGGVPGLHLRFGGMASGSGFGAGPEYYRPDLAEGRMSFRAFGAVSTKQWYLIEAELSFPHLAGKFPDLSILGRRTDSNSIDYYGPGPDSRKAGRSNYRREETCLGLSVEFNSIRRLLSTGFNAGYMWLRTGPGQSDDVASTEKIYRQYAIPGIHQQTNYLRTGLFFDLDSRDKPRDPHSGTHFRIELNRYSDRKYGRYSFRRIESSIEQYLSYYNKKRVIALRAHSIFNYPVAGNEVPFYMQATLGGASDLRGYPRYRFSDNNRIAMNAEYRWEVFTLMDAAIFADAGKVFEKDSHFDFDNFESDAGLGVRFKSREAVAFRVDTAFSREGFGLWFTFDHVF